MCIMCNGNCICVFYVHIGPYHTLINHDNLIYIYRCNRKTINDVKYEITNIYYYSYKYIHDIPNMITEMISINQNLNSNEKR